MARVIEVLKVRDEQVQAAQVQVLSTNKTTMLRRPMNLILLEMNFLSVEHSELDRK